MKRPTGSTAGFTIIELLVVVTLVLALTSIVAPTFRISPSKRVENQAHLIVAHLEMARTHALGERQLTHVQFDTINDRYIAYVDHDDNDAVTQIAAEAAAYPEFGLRQLEDLIGFGRGSAATVPGDAGTQAVTTPGAAVVLDPQGIPAPWGTMGTIYLVHERDNTAVSAISVASSGAFKAWRWWPDAGEWR